MKVEMDVNVLLGMENFVSKDQHRANINCVRFEDDKVIATNGHVMARLVLGKHFNGKVLSDGDSFHFELTKDVLGFLKNNKKEKVLVIHKDDVVTLSCGSSTILTDASKTTFAKWEQVIPNGGGSVEEIALNPKLIAKFEKFHKLANNGGVCLRFDFGQDDMSPVKIKLSSIPEDDFLGVLMPMRP